MVKVRFFKVIELPNVLVENAIYLVNSGEDVDNSVKLYVTDTDGNSKEFVPQLSYKKYVALLNQSDTSAPSATVLENDLGGSITWSRSNVGFYIATSNGLFTENKVVTFLNSSIGDDVLMFTRVDDNTCYLITYASSVNANRDNYLSNTPIEIRIY